MTAEFPILFSIWTYVDQGEIPHFHEELRAEKIIHADVLIGEKLKTISVDLPGLATPIVMHNVITTIASLSQSWPSNLLQVD